MCFWKLLHICALGHSIHGYSLPTLQQQPGQQTSSMQAPIMEEQPVQQGPAGSATLDAAAFQKLYPLEYMLRWLAEGLRPDGRTLGKARTLSISLGALSKTQGSALVKLGSTTVLAGGHACGCHVSLCNSRT